tara:strand:+ start:76 stop:438 length:363 start_codon:yes stop_codon:yes gene_type:complete
VRFAARVLKKWTSLIMSEPEKNEQPEKGDDSLTSRKLRSISVAQEWQVTIPLMIPGKKYHFSLEELPCRIGVFEKKSKVTIHEAIGPEWLVRLRDGTVIIERQIMAIRKLSEYTVFTTLE